MSEPGCTRFAAIGLLLFIAVVTVPQINSASVWDDGYMFVRYAGNVLQRGKIAWNPDGDPTYGPTSMLFLLCVSVPMRFLLPGDPGAAAALSSVLCGAAFIGLTMFMVRRLAPGRPELGNALVLAVLACFALAIRALSDHFVSGMDTSFALAFLTLYLIICQQHERTPSRRTVLLLGLVGGLAMAARPDLLIFSFIVPASMLVFAPEARARRDAARILALTALAAALQCALAKIYFNSPLPLSFYVKGQEFYGENIRRVYRFVPLREFTSFVQCYWPLFLTIILSITGNPRAWWAKSSPVHRGVALSTALFLSYYLFGVLQIAFHSQRFYHPVLPALVFLACDLVVRIVQDMPDERKDLLAQLAQAIPKRATRVLVVLLIAAFLLPPFSRAVKALPRSFAFDLREEYRQRWNRYWAHLDQFSALPNDLVMATTEVGRPSVMNPEKAILDLAGLNDTEIARHGFDADHILQKSKPDLLYMPYQHYAEMIEQILNSPYFKAHYELFPAPLSVTAMPVAIHKQSKRYRAMKAIIQERRPP